MYTILRGPDFSRLISYLSVFLSFQVLISMQFWSPMQSRQTRRLIPELCSPAVPKTSQSSKTLSKLCLVLVINFWQQVGVCRGRGRWQMRRRCWQACCSIGSQQTVWRRRLQRRLDICCGGNGLTNETAVPASLLRHWKTNDGMAAAASPAARDTRDDPLWQGAQPGCGCDGGAYSGPFRRRPLCSSISCHHHRAAPRCCAGIFFIPAPRYFSPGHLSPAHHHI